MTNIQPFACQALALPVTVTATASTSAALPAVGNTIRVVNEGPNVCFISVGTGSQTATLPNATATATSTPIAVGDTSLTIPYTTTALNISAICRASQTAAITVQVGEGI